jgi:uncharacterized protein YndB with AHSA1/START domain
MDPIIIERSLVIRASRERVWRALTTPAEIAKWFEPIGFARLAVGEPLTFTWGGAGEIALVEPPHRFGYRWQLVPPHPEQTLVVFSLESVPDGTRVTITETGFEALPDDARQKKLTDNTGGWEAMIAQLGEYVQRVPDA